MSLWTIVEETVLRSSTGLTKRCSERPRILNTDAPTIALHDWLILDALSDDYESVEQIAKHVQPDWQSPDPLEIIERLEHLHSAGLVFLTLDATFDGAEMVREISQTSSRRFWFGRTPTGDALWQRQAADFGYE
jgi:hypothetical protein